MAREFIWDSDPSTHSNPNTYGTLAEIQTAIQSAVGSNDLTSDNQGGALIRVRCSDGGTIATPIIRFNYWPTDANNPIKFLFEKSNGFPAVVTEVLGSTKNGLIDNKSQYMIFEAAEENSGIIRANDEVGETRTLVLSNSENCSFVGMVIDGRNNASVAGLGGAATNSTFTNCKIVGCDFEFSGALRFGGATLNYCTIYDCATVRPSTNYTFTNCLFINSPFYSGTSVGAASDYNATSQAQGDITGSINLGANSLYSVDKDTELQIDSVGGFNVLPTATRLIGASSDGTNIGAYAETISANAPVISISVAGDTLTLLVSTNGDIDASCVPFVNGSPVSAQEQNKTAGINQLTWDLTGFAPITNPTNEIYTITVEVTDADNAKSTSNSRIYSKAYKVILTGNSLSGPTNLADEIGGSESLRDMLENMFAANGKYIYALESLKGNGIFADHTADPLYMETVSSGNYDLILVQGEGRSSVTPDTTTYYNTEAKPLVDAVKSAQTDFAFYSHHEKEDSTEAAYLSEKQIQEDGAALLGVELVPTSTVWHSIRVADPTIDMWGDNTHQNYVGAYVYCLSLYKYLTGESVVGNSYQPASLTLAPYSLTQSQVDLLQAKVDQNITTQFVRSTVNSATVSITSPSSYTEYNEGDSATFIAVANDSTDGDVSANIEWTIGLDSTVVGTGSTYNSSSLPTGQYTVNAKVTGSDGNITQASRLIKVRSLVNEAPVITLGSRSIDFNSPWTQVNLNTYVTDDNSEIDWSTLTIVTQPTQSRVPVSIDDLTAGVVNLDYSTTDYSGSDFFTYTVADLSGAVSQEGRVDLTINPKPSPSGSITNATIVRGQDFDITLLNYTSSGLTEDISVKIVDVNNGNTEYDCAVKLNSSETITATAPDTGIAPVMTGATVVITVAVS